MKATLPVTALLVVTLFGGCARPEKPPLTGGKGIAFYVATNGNDSWSGTLATPRRNGKDGPYATVPMALQQLRKLRAGGTLEGCRIVVRSGTYFLDEPMVLLPGDSGLTIEAYGGERPVLSGGRRITGWRSNPDGKTLVAEVPPALLNEGHFRELWVNGQRAVRARHPAKGYLPVAELLDKASDWTQGHRRFRYREGDIEAVPGLTNAEMMVMTRWVESRLPITNIDALTRVISFGKRSVFELGAGDLYYIEGALEFLDQPGEWFLDRVNRKIYYLPRPGEKAALLDAIAPLLVQCVRLDGDPESNQFIRNLTLRGLTFAHTEWCFPEGFAKDKPTISPAPNADIGGFAQAAIGVPGAVWGEGLRQCTFERCEFTNLGTYGLELAQGCVKNLISRCTFSELGAGGIKLGTTSIPKSDSQVSRDNVVSDCQLFNGGRMFHSAIGIWIGQSPGNQLLHNLIHDFYYTGISVGWTWGYSTALATNTLVVGNHVHHIGVQSNGDGPILSDMSGIYTLGKQHGSAIVNNLWHDVAGLHYGGWGIYFDEGTAGILAASNIVYRTTHGGFHQHYGATNLLVNNVFAFARDYQVQRTRPEPHISFTFQTNIVYFDQGVLFGGNFSGDKFAVDHNFYWDLRSAPGVTTNLGAGTWDKWRSGHDANSTWVDPMFVDPGRDDFRLKPGSPASSGGFQPIDLRQVGPRRQ